ncbi:MAG: glycoside hydrolase family 43 protein [Bacteroidota bacterium]
MRSLIKYIFVAAGLLTYNFSSLAQEQKAVIAGDFADPSIIRKDKQYFAVGTSSEWAPHFPIYTSTNLTDWKQTGYVFDEAPEWTSGSFWAPEYYLINKTYYIYYTARRKKDNVSYIGVATSKRPDRGFKDHGVIIEHGKEAIDAFVYNDNGQLYITFKAYGLDNRPIEILGSKLSADGLKLEGEVFSLFKDDKKIGLEGQSIIKKDNYYYLFYSAGNCCGVQCDYNVRIARSKNFKGPYEDFSNNPVLKEATDWKCTGHGTFVNTPEGKTYYLYHAYNKTTTVFTGRQGMLAELTWPTKGGWPVFKAEPNSLAKNLGITANFMGVTPEDYWQWDFRNSSPAAKQLNGKLHLSGVIQEENHSGVVYTVRPTTSNYEISTVVTNHNDAQKGLVIYGDANSAIGIAAIGDKVELWIVKANKRTVLASAPISATGDVMLTMKITPDLKCSAMYKSTTSGGWKTLAAEDGVTISFLPPWDRSPRAGLNFMGNPDQSAIFSSFTLVNK